MTRDQIIISRTVYFYLHPKTPMINLSYKCQLSIYLKFIHNLMSVLLLLALVCLQAIEFTMLSIDLISSGILLSCQFLHRCVLLAEI